MRHFRRKRFGCASRTRREQSIRPKISRIDFDLIELENSEVWSGPPKPVVEFHTATGSAWSRDDASTLSTPAGKRPSARRASASAESGVSSDGFTTTGQPAATWKRAIRRRFDAGVPRVPKKSIHASRPFRAMIARPRIGPEEWKAAERGAFRKFAVFSRPGGGGRRDLARDHGHGEVPGRDGRADAHGLAHGQEPPVGARVRLDLAGDARRLLGEPLDERPGQQREIQRRFNVSVPRARVPEKAPTRRDRSER